MCKENYIFSTGVCRECGSETEGTNYARTNCICKNKKQLFNIPSLKCVNLPDNSILNKDYTDFECLLGYKNKAMSVSILALQELLPTKPVPVSVELDSTYKEIFARRQLHALINQHGTQQN